jgi:hypothetical protein
LDKYKSLWILTHASVLEGTILTMKKLLILLFVSAFICDAKASIIAELVIEGLPVNVISAGKSYKVYEQYPWEGYSSRYGPKGNRLDSGHGVGVGKNIKRSLQVRQGDWIHMPGIGWRQINESSSKNDGIEFFATRRDEYKDQHPRLTIDKVVFALPSQETNHPPLRLAGLVPAHSGNSSPAPLLRSNAPVAFQRQDARFENVSAVP